MNHLHELYRHNLTLLTDLYQLTMAQGYWKLGRADQEAVFHLFFRRNPFHGGYTIAAGLDFVLDYVKGFRFGPTDIDYLASLMGHDGTPLFDRTFLEYLAGLRLSVNIDAVPEGTAVFPHEPLVRVSGPILECQILESALLNIVNFQSLVATKAARLCGVAGGEPVVEFGLRRAQGIDGSLAASRAAFIGGCAATSNVLAGKLFGIPVRGTHAHSWVMSFDNELTAFEAYAETAPNNCVFLVDTYDTLDGVRHAVEVGRRLKQSGHKLIGIRLDSGDLAYLSIEARQMLDEAGLTDTAIMATNDLDEGIIESLKRQGATINVWGVGTKLVTAYDQPALGGVYKLGAVRNGNGPWEPKLKLSEQAIKTSTPGILQVRRFLRNGAAVADMIYSELLEVTEPPTIIDPLDPTRRKPMRDTSGWEDLLVPVVRAGDVVYDRPPLAAIRDRTSRQVAMFHPTVRRLLNPHHYPVGLERGLHEMKTALILEARGHVVAQSGTWGEEGTTIAD
jgi:nicotinate phosphoribosyltransferase